jgi:arginine/lysine/ornithine decarboxylase
VDKLYDKLISYSEEDYYPMHMPGHKRNTKMMHMLNSYAIDITEIEGFDNLHHAEGILRQLGERIASLYNCQKSYPLVNGSTAGILAGISAATNRGDKILLARNCHKSVYHGAILMGLQTIYINPPMVEKYAINGGILSDKIEELLIKEENIKLIVITSPTYEGVVSDIESIAKVAHQRGAFLLVDEAHGAHFEFHKEFPVSALHLGADLVIQSLHKTLPALTQTAVLHCNREILLHKLEQYLAIYESSSPSYVLLASIDRCITLLEENAKDLFQMYCHRLDNLHNSLRSLMHLKLLNDAIVGQDGIYNYDKSKIIIFLKNTSWNGHQLHAILRERYHIVMEMEAINYVLGMTSICDTEEGFDRLAAALIAIDQEMELDPSNLEFQPSTLSGLPEQVIKLQEAVEMRTETVKVKDSIGRISATFVSLFPPGSPILTPGERMNEELVKMIIHVRQVGLTITGLLGENNDEIAVICNNTSEID